MPRCVSPTPIDDATFAAFLQRAIPAARRLLLRLAGTAADADDVLQETLAKVWRHRARFDPAKNGDAWLLQAAFRCFCDQRKRRRAAAAGGDAAAAIAAPSRPCAVELRDELRHRLQALDPLARALLVGFHGDGRSLQELAREHGLPVNTVKSHLHRARLRLHAAAGRREGREERERR
jgi:RNA polymerase sigma-70 factor, ECF subfamily